MRFIKYLLFFFGIGLFSGLGAQDIHWSLYQMSPLTLNPALTGAYHGTFRVGGIYRDQARAAISNAYVTPSFYIDSPLLRVGKRDWIGVGGVLYNDQAGAGKLKNLGMLGSVAFHKALDKKGKTLLSFGVQAGMVQRRINVMDLRLGDGLEIELGGGQYFSENETDIDDNTSYFDLSAGVLISSEVNKQTDLNIGISIYHLTKPGYGLIGTNKNRVSTNPDTIAFKLPQRFQLHGQFNFKMGKQWAISPNFLYNRISSASELQVQAMLGYLLNKEKQTTLKFGPGYRIGDAAQLLLGLDIKDLKIAASYDITLSGLSDVNSSVGGFEIAVAYIAKIYKAPVVKPVIFCPRF